MVTASTLYAGDEARMRDFEWEMYRTADEMGVNFRLERQDSMLQSIRLYTIGTIAR